jgi:putative aldouronate transport system permease protein
MQAYSAVKRPALETSDRPPRPHSLLRDLARGRDMYLLLIPGMAFLLVFHFAPLFGIMIAFKDYQIFAGRNPVDAMLKSPWVGFSYFEQIFRDPYFFEVLSNTLIISFYKIFFLFPVPIVLALLLNEIGSVPFKRSVQTFIYIPHFISWPVIYGLFFTILSGDGVVNRIITGLGYQRILFFMDNRVFRGVLVFSEGWKEAGWGTIIYLASIAGIDPQLYEAATMDGAGKLRQALSITLPGIATTIVILLILRLGNLMEAGFMQVLAMYNPTVYDSADIIQTYVYRTGLGQLRFSYGTAFGLFNSFVSFTLIVSANFLSRRISGRSIW